MSRQAAWRMVKRRAEAAGVFGGICNHSFRGTGITNHLENGGSLSEAQRMAGHADPRTTRLYDRRDRKISRGEVERITIWGDFESAWIWCPMSPEGSLSACETSSHE